MDDPKRTLDRGAFVLRVAGVGILALLLSPFLMPGWPTSLTCAICRADRRDTSWLGRTWTQLDETQCSRWYASNVESNHEHHWARKPVGRRTILGGFACWMGDPIGQFPAFLQLQVYQHFDDSLAAKALFVRIGKHDDDGGRIQSELEDWAVAGFPGRWEDWWIRAKERDEG